MVKMSSMYLVSSRGLLFCVLGEHAEPIAMPLICWNVRLANSKQLLLTLICKSFIIRLGSKMSRCLLSLISS